jgi:hypothetical protein
MSERIEAGTVDSIGVRDELEVGVRRGGTVDDVIRLKGRMVAELYGPDGELKELREVDNLITTVGRNSVVDNLLASPTLGKPTHMEVGTSGTAAAVGDTTITGAFGRVALTSKNRATNVLTMVGDWAAGVATGALQEAGVWDASTAGTLWARATFTTINKAAGDTLKITWTWTIG